MPDSPSTDTVSSLLAAVRAQHVQLHANTPDLRPRLSQQQLHEINAEIAELSAQADALSEFKLQMQQQIRVGNSQSSSAALSPAMSRLHSTKSSVEDSSDEHVANLRESVRRRHEQLMQRAPGSRGNNSAVVATRAAAEDGAADRTVVAPAPASAPSDNDDSMAPPPSSRKRMFHPPRLNSQPYREPRLRQNNGKEVCASPHSLTHTSSWCFVLLLY